MQAKRHSYREKEDLIKANPFPLPRLLSQQDHRTKAELLFRRSRAPSRRSNLDFDLERASRVNKERKLAQKTAFFWPFVVVQLCVCSSPEVESTHFAVARVQTWTPPIFWPFLPVARAGRAIKAADDIQPIKASSREGSLKPFDVTPQRRLSFLSAFFLSFFAPWRSKMFCGELFALSSSHKSRKACVCVYVRAFSKRQRAFSYFPSEFRGQFSNCLYREAKWIAITNIYSQYSCGIDQVFFHKLLYGLHVFLLTAAGSSSSEFVCSLASFPA